MARVLILNENESVPHDRRVVEIGSSLLAAGHEVTVICPAGKGGEAAPYELRNGLEIHRYPPREAGGNALSYLVEYGWALFETWRRIRRLSRTRRFDVVHACNPPDVLLLCALGQRRRGAALIFDHHDLVPELYLSRFERGRDWLYRLTLAAERLAFRLADVVIATNESYREVALTRGRKAPGDVFVVRNAPDLRRFSTSSAPHGSSGHVLCYVGMMGPQDGLDHALRALAVLREWRDDWRAVFVGEGEMLEELKALAHGLGLADVVEFTGWLEEDGVIGAVAEADVCLAPDPSNPLNDASSMVKIVEYMALARPIVSYDLRETRVTAADAALYAEPNDPESFARCIASLLDDPELRRRMGEVGRRRIEGALAWEHAERELHAAYDRALRRGG